MGYLFGVFFTFAMTSLGIYDYYSMMCLRNFVTVCCLAILSSFFAPDTRAECSRDSVQLVTGGLKAEANMSGYVFPDLSSDVVHADPGFGGTFGGFVFFDFHRHFGLQMEWLYHVRMAHVHQPGHKGLLFYAGFEVPLYWSVQWTFNRCDRVFLLFGPTVEYGYKAQIFEDGESIDLYKKDDETQLSAMKDVSMGWSFVFGYEFRFGLQVQLSCKMGFYNILDANRSEVEAYPYSLSAGLAYRFGAMRGRGGAHGK